MALRGFSEYDHHLLEPCACLLDILSLCALQMTSRFWDKHEFGWKASYSRRFGNPPDALVQMFSTWKKRYMMDNALSISPGKYVAGSTRRLVWSPNVARTLQMLENCSDIVTYIPPIELLPRRMQSCPYVTRQFCFHALLYNHEWNTSEQRRFADLQREHKIDIIVELSSEFRDDATGPYGREIISAVSICKPYIGMVEVPGISWNNVLKGIRVGISLSELLHISRTPVESIRAYCATIVGILFQLPKLSHCQFELDLGFNCRHEEFVVFLHTLPAAYVHQWWQLQLGQCIASIRCQFEPDEVETWSPPVTVDDSESSETSYGD